MTIANDADRAVALALIQKTCHAASHPASVILKAMCVDCLAQAITAARSNELEACATIARNIGMTSRENASMWTGKRIEDAIRARGEVKP